MGESNIFHGTVTEVGSVTLESGRRLLIAHQRTGRHRVGVLMRPERFGSGANCFNGEVKEASISAPRSSSGSPATTGWN